MNYRAPISLVFLQYLEISLRYRVLTQHMSTLNAEMIQLGMHIAQVKPNGFYI